LTDSHSPGPAHDSAMDQALNWLIELEGADAEQRARFEAWLAADPAHGQAFARAEAVWNSQPVFDAALTLAAPKKAVGAAPFAPALGALGHGRRADNGPVQLQ